MYRATAFIALTVFVLVLSLLRSLDSTASTSSDGEVFQHSETIMEADKPKPKPEMSDNQNMTQMGNKVVLKRGYDSHFRATVKINGRDIEMMVDSGASVVALSRKDAERIGMYTNVNDFTQTAQGAGGSIPVKSVMFDRVAVGNIERTNVEGMIIGADGDESLLGQSFLRQLGTVTVEGDTMIIQ